MSDLVTLDRFVFFPDAEIARATLEAAGIDAVLISDSSKPTEGVILRVHADDLAEAREILDAPMELEVEREDALEDEEHCRRCFSTEIYPAETRGKTFARITIIATAVAIGLRFAVFVQSLMGVAVDDRVNTGIFAVLWIVSLFALVYAAVAPKKRCRNCGLEWRGTQRPS